MFGNHNLLSDGAQTEGVVLDSNMTHQESKRKVRVAVTFDDGEKAEFTEVLTNYYVPKGQGLKGITDTTVIPISFGTGIKIPVRYDPDNHKHVAVDVPALHAATAQVLHRGTERAARTGRGVARQLVVPNANTVTPRVVTGGCLARMQEATCSSAARAFEDAARRRRGPLEWNRTCVRCH